MNIKSKLSHSALIISIIAVVNILVLMTAQINSGWYWVLVITTIMFIIAIYDTFQKVF